MLVYNSRYSVITQFEIIPALNIYMQEREKEHP